MPTRALARFASDALDRVLDVAAGDADPSKVADALSTLHKIVFLDVMPPNVLGRVVEVARSRMMTTAEPMVWQTAVDLALATGDAGLRGLVTNVAMGVEDPVFSRRNDLRLWAQSAARRALGRYGRPRGGESSGPSPRACGDDR